MTDLKGQKEGRKRKDREERREVGKETARGDNREKESKRRETERGGDRGKKEETLTKEKKYITTYVNTYQLISS